MLIVGFTVVFVLVMCYCNYIYSRHPKSIPFILLYSFELIWILISVVYIEHGTYISEIATFSYATGGSIRFIFVTLPFALCAPVLFDRRLKTKEIRLLRFGSMTLSLELLTLVSSLICMYVFFNVVISGNVYVNPNITKGNFYSTYSRLPLAGELGAGYLKAAVFILGICVFDSKSNSQKKKFAFAMFVMALLSKIAIGEKFYGLYTLVFYFLLYKLVKVCENINMGHRMKIKQIVTCGLVFMIVFFCVYQLGYVKSSKLGYMMAFTKTDNALDAMLSRALALQGHTWWGIDRILVEAKEYWGSLSQTVREIKAAILDVSVYDSTIGLGRIMHLVAPENIASAYLTKHTRFYGGYWTVGVSVLGYIGTMAFGIFVAYLFALTYSTLYKALVRRDYLSALICLLYSLNLYEFFRIGNLSLLFTMRALFRFALILLMNARKRDY